MGQMSIDISVNKKVILSFSVYFLREFVYIILYFQSYICVSACVIFMETNTDLCVVMNEFCI